MATRSPYPVAARAPTSAIERREAHDRIRVAEAPERERRMHAEVVDAEGPRVVARQEQADAEMGGVPERAERRVAVEAGPPAVEALRELPPSRRRRALVQHGERLGGPEGADERTGDAVPRLGDAGPGAPREGLERALRIRRVGPDAGDGGEQLLVAAAEQAAHRTFARRLSAVPSSRRPGRGTSARSATVQASRSTRS